MGDVINGSGAFHKYFAGTPYVSMEIFVTVALGLGIALGIHVLGQYADRHLKGWRAAEKCLADQAKPEATEIPNSEENFKTLMYRHMFLFLLGYGLQLALIFPWIHWIAGIISNT
jgi:hypothetical protein